MKIAIINYGYGNLHSVNQAFKKANNDYDLNAEIEVTNNPNEIKDLVIEMDERLNGRWIETNEDKLLQKKQRPLLSAYSV